MGVLTSDKLLSKISKIRSGGQTGVDRAALDTAKALGVEIVGWVPKGGIAEDFLEPPGILAGYPELRETPCQKVGQRTVRNVRDADATLIIVTEEVTSPGTSLTITTAEELKKPYYISDGKDAEKIKEWLSSQKDGLVLNVAGPRESESPGIYETTRNMLAEVLKEGNV
jgi:hypothetical protein